MISIIEKFYFFSFHYIIGKLEQNVNRKKVFNALVAEGITGLSEKYQNIHLLPIYQKKTAYGSKGFPWTIANRDISYEKGICPNAEKLNDATYLGLAMCMYDFENEDVNLIIEAFHKVFNNLELLQ